MTKDDLLFYINEKIVKKGQYYIYQNVPQQIGNAIYLYGNNQILDIVIFIDTSHEQNGSTGMIINLDNIYFQLNQKGSFRFKDILSLSLEKHRHQNIKGIIKTNDNEYFIEDENIDIENFIDALSHLTNIDIDFQMTMYEKIEHYINLVLHDIENNEYEDLELTSFQKQQINEFYQNLQIIESLDDENYQYELEILCQQAINYFNDLGLDSDEVDMLINIQEEINNKKEQAFHNAQNYYDDIMHQYQQSNPRMFEQMKSMMNMLGIDENELRNKSPDELNHYVEDLCQRFGISKEQIENLAKRFQQKE